VPRRWGWDTHGLPVENLIEKELGLKNKKDIEEYGIGKFNEAARASVLRYDAEWKKIIPRSGRWVDMDDPYLTMQPTYTESIWWSFKTLHQKNLINQGYKVMYVCPRCETSISNFEVTQGYKDITDISVYVKFELTDEPATFVLAWTTTPWTLPGNVGLAVGNDIDYAVVNFDNIKYIVAKERVVYVFKDKAHTIESEVKGNLLVGKKYKPVFNYYQNQDLKGKENAWKIYGADFVTTTDGTGVVHIAPAYGEDDYKLATRENLPVIHHVGMDGLFKKEVTDLAGYTAKPKDDHQKGDVEIIKLLAVKGTLFAKEKIIHSYPHCWRCDTPLLNYATESWFVKVTEIKDTLVNLNKKVQWVPEEIGEGRFGKWLENARDWAISRSRYWGAPLPVWVCKICEKKEIIGSIDDLKKHTKRNDYFIIRHGEAENNKQNILSCDPENVHCLTDNGVRQVEEAVQKLQDKKIDLIISSDLFRTKQTAELIQKKLNLSKDSLILDERLREYNFGDYNKKGVDSWHTYWATKKWGDINEKVPGGESPQDVLNRVASFINEIDSKYNDKTILIVSHNDPIRFLISVVQGNDISKISKDEWRKTQFINAQVQKMEYAKIPHNNYVLDLHRPYIDEISFGCECGGEMHRIPEVFDTWYESGSMPYASIHYPFKNKEKIDKNEFFPADFIAEGQDQTRGWFYSLLVLSAGLFGVSPYKNVLVNGIVLAEDGQKMAKRLKNYPELDTVFNTYGADALRYFLMASPAVRADDIAFSEKGLDEVVKKVISKLDNVYTFYKTYEKGVGELQEKPISPHVLDQWITARLNQITQEVTASLEKYELDRAARPFVLFIDDLSTWYLRRSRDRFKGDDILDRDNALLTIRYILRETAKLIAPFMPFMAEDLYQKVKGKDGKESVHLESWPEPQEADQDIIVSMQKTRDIVSLGLEARAKVGIKVRQPLASLKVNIVGLYIDLLKDEVNVKEIIEFAEEGKVELDTTITPELKLEGQAREFIRSLQDLRKKAGLSPSDTISLTVDTSDEGKNIIDSFKT
ncbi:MAG: class I tRNA ligase family protein, partial [bacterium]|nr:class I tRNA ligase family protein [bacterium]